MKHAFGISVLLAVCVREKQRNMHELWQGRDYAVNTQFSVRSRGALGTTVVPDENRLVLKRFKSVFPPPGPCLLEKLPFGG